MIDIVIADDDQLVSLSLKTILEASGERRPLPYIRNTIQKFCSWISAWTP